MPFPNRQNHMMENKLEVIRGLMETHEYKKTHEGSFWGHRTIPCHDNGGDDYTNLHVLKLIK